MINKDKIQADTTYAVALQNVDDLYPVNMGYRYERTMLFNLYYYHPKFKAHRDKEYKEYYDRFQRDLAQHNNNDSQRMFNSFKPQHMYLLNDMVKWFREENTEWWPQQKDRYPMTGPRQVKFLHDMAVSTQEQYIKHIMATPQYKYTYNLYKDNDAVIKKKRLKFNDISPAEQHQEVASNIILDTDAPTHIAEGENLYGYGNLHNCTYSETVNRNMGHFHWVNEIYIKMTGKMILKMYDNINWLTTRVICPVELVDNFIKQADEMFANTGAKIQQHIDAEMAEIHNYLDNHPNRQYYDFTDYTYPQWDAKLKAVTPLPKFKKFRAEAGEHPELRDLTMYYSQAEFDTLMPVHQKMDRKILEIRHHYEQMANATQNNTHKNTVEMKQEILKKNWQATLKNWEMKMFTVGQQI